MSLYLRPSTLAEALDCLARAPCPLAGGTDLYPATKAAELPGDLTDLSGLADLRGITPLPGGGLRIGACTTWTEIALAPLPPALHALQVAARAVGGRQIQTAGTIGGNLCNASPAADGVPPLLVTDAEVEVLSPGGTRRMALADFITGPRRTALVPGELLVAIHIPGAGLQWGSSFQKLGARAYLVISIAMVAARVVWRDGLIADVALAVGACGPVARRLSEVEAALQGATVAQAHARIDPSALARVLSPIDDPRASATYRIEAATELCRRAVAGVAP